MMLRLSPYVLPQIRMGLHPLKPQNLTVGPERLHYAKNCVRALQRVMQHHGVEEAKRIREELPFGANFTIWNEEAEGKDKLEVLPELENSITFDAEQLGVLIRDGRIRDDSQMVYLPSGSSTPALMDLLRLLHRGIDRAEFIATAAESEVAFDDELLDELIGRGVVEEGSVAAPAAITAPAIEWIGHAYVRAVGPTATAWFDPFTSPRIRWTAEERGATFAESVPDKYLLSNYGPDAHQVTQDELAIPSAIFITHQDTDHMDLGVIGLVPPEVPIYVPESDGSPWQVDLVAAIKNVLGPERNVRVFKHGETVDLDDFKVTAFPFNGEFPKALPHHWNCFYVELPDQVWALCADSAITADTVSWLTARRKGDTRPFGIMVNDINDRPIIDGYRDMLEESTSFTRLYSWYITPAQMYETVPMCGLFIGFLKQLVTDARLSYVYPYAHGNLPWYRMTQTFLHHAHVGSHTLPIFDRMEKVALLNGARVLRLKHGEPHAPAAQSAYPRRS